MPFWLYFDNFLNLIKNLYKSNTTQKEIEEINNFIEKIKENEINRGEEAYLISENLETEASKKSDEINIINENEEIGKIEEQNKRTEITIPNLDKPNPLSINSLNDF